MPQFSCARQAADSVLALDASDSLEPTSVFDDSQRSTLSDLLDVFSVFEAMAADDHMAYQEVELGASTCVRITSLCAWVRVPLTHTLDMSTQIILMRGLLLDCFINVTITSSRSKETHLIGLRGWPNAWQWRSQRILKVMNFAYGCIDFCHRRYIYNKNFDHYNCLLKFQGHPQSHYSFASSTCIILVIPRQYFLRHRPCLVHPEI